MSTTLQAESFAAINLEGHERTTLSEDVEEGGVTVTVVNTAGFETGDIVYVGTLGREGCEYAVVDDVSDSTTMTLTGLFLAHSRFEPITGVLGDQIRIYRAINSDGTPPPDEEFSALDSVPIKPEQLSTYYTDNNGSSDYWYKITYWNEGNDDETSLDDAVPVRGDDFGHYATLGDIRTKAGFENALNLADYVIDQHRRAAESYINGALASVYTVPFTPVPPIINTLTIELAAAELLSWAYPGAYDKRLKDAKAAITDATIVLGDDGVEAPTSSDAVSSYPTANEPRMFEIDQVF